MLERLEDATMQRWRNRLYSTNRPLVGNEHSQSHVSFMILCYSSENSSMEESSREKEREKFIAIARRHFERKGYRVHSGLQFGVELVLYADDPQRVHSDFCVHVLGPGGGIDWRNIQTLVRSMPDLHKTLILAHVKEKPGCDGSSQCIIETNGDSNYIVEEIAIASEHAPFRHKKVNAGVGGQIKRQKPTTKDHS